MNETLIRLLDETDKVQVWAKAFEYFYNEAFNLENAFETALGDVVDHLNPEDCDSTNIQEAHYNHKAGTVEITYRSGKYMYSSTPEEFQGLRKAGSVGQYVNQVYKDGRKYWKV